MSYKLVYHPDILSEDLPIIPRNIKDTIQRAIEKRLMVDPLLSGAPLRQSLKGYRKLRVGDYRVIYMIQSDTIIVLKIGHHKEVYTQVFARIC